MVAQPQTKFWKLPGFWPLAICVGALIALQFFPVRDHAYVEYGSPWVRWSFGWPWAFLRFGWGYPEDATIQAVLPDWQRGFKVHFVALLGNAGIIAMLTYAFRMARSAMRTKTFRISELLFSVALVAVLLGAVKRDPVQAGLCGRQIFRNEDYAWRGRVFNHEPFVYTEVDPFMTYEPPTYWPGPDEP